jgi:hypothetical protein
MKGRRAHLVARERAVAGVAARAGVLRELLLASAQATRTQANVSHEDYAIPGERKMWGAGSGGR